MTQHHCYAVSGTDPNRFVEVGVKRTTDDSDLEYFVHHHGYDMLGLTPCNKPCQVIRSGEAENVTQTDDANSKTVG